MYAASTNWASIGAKPRSCGRPQGAIRPTRLGYYIAKDPHLVGGVIGGSVH